MDGPSEGQDRGVQVFAIHTIIRTQVTLRPY